MTIRTIVIIVVVLHPSEELVLTTGEAFGAGGVYELTGRSELFVMPLAGDPLNELGVPVIASIYKLAILNYLDNIY